MLKSVSVQLLTNITTTGFPPWETEKCRKEMEPKKITQKLPNGFL